MLLEGNEIGSAASGRNNGQVIPHHSKAAPSEMEQLYGKVIGQRYNELVMGSAAFLFDTIRRFKIEAHAVQNGWMQPAHSEAAAARGRRFYQEWKALGADVEWMDGAEASRITGSSYLAAWKANTGGHINPYGLVTGLASALKGLGVTIFENTRAEKIDRDGHVWRVRCKGGSVVARKVVLTTNALTRDIWPKLGRAMVPFRVYNAATAPIPEPLRSQIFVGNVGVSDTRRDIRAFHYDRDFRIVAGATHTFWHNAEARGLVRIQRMLEAAFPQLGPLARVDDYWEGSFAVVPDRKPRLFRLGDGLMFGGIYSGRGVAVSLSLGRRLGENAAGHPRGRRAAAAGHRHQDGSRALVRDAGRQPYPPLASPARPAGPIAPARSAITKPDMKNAAPRRRRVRVCMAVVRALRQRFCFSMVSAAM